MRTAIYVTEGVAQVVLTPDTEWERTVLAMFASGAKRAMADTTKLPDGADTFVPRRAGAAQANRIRSAARRG